MTVATAVGGYLAAETLKSAALGPVVALSISEQAAAENKSIAATTLRAVNIQKTLRIAVR